MYEQYGNPKFKTIFLSKKLPKTNKSNELIKWFRKFDKIGLALDYSKGSSGNLSFRYKDGFFIKSTKTYFRTIMPKDLVFIKNVDVRKKFVYACGTKIPSTELQMHYLIYKNKKDVNAIAHLHDYDVMAKAKQLEIPITKVTEAGTPKIGYDVLRVVDENNYVIMRSHGIVSLGKTINEACKNALKFHNLSKHSE